ncbi:E3 ubiquitin protein ligase DRIP2 [Morus notabilis]|uniref:E3 ubiquitin protein ligase DRIP2 n=1 Tax=Morus notabilis TaxID=981085 RepID=W9QNU8_9ROSA|nr:E3 ubiquitin protein ligase DRIP2 [Morus notabilis]EXB29847.1 E3 ubiquitin protein ligase DRIP2 [Morus notabilis]
MMMMVRKSGSYESQVVKVGKEKILGCLTCSICDKLFVDATTISECLHTFCRKCIYEKIADEELDHCPVCNTHLGCVPLDKLRVDHNLQDLRAKIFPFETKTGNASHAVPSAPFQAKRKERSLSSLVVNAPRARPESCFTARRKNPTRKNLVRSESAHLDHKPVKKADECLEKILKIAANGKQAEEETSRNESYKQQIQKDNVEDNAKPFEGKSDMWKPLKTMVEAPSKTKAKKANLQETMVESVGLNSEVYEPKVRVKKQGKRSRVHGSGSDETLEPSGSVKRRKTLRQRRAATSGGFNVPARSMEVANSEFGRRFGPIWFSLIASNEQQGNAPLQQIPSCYLRVKDGSLPVSLVKKYLARKLGLASEAEVEISLRGQPVNSTFKLHNLVDLWIRTAPSSDRIQTSAGSSGKDFVMVLSYGRKSSA